MKTVYFSFVCVLFFVNSSFSAFLSPSFTSIRARTMGNAYVALVNNNEALNYNMAGLSLIGVDNKNNAIDFTVLEIIAGISEHYAILSPLIKPIFDKSQPFSSVLDSFASDNTIEDLDNRSLPIYSQARSAIAFKNFGVGAWVKAVTYPYLNSGILLPTIGVNNTYYQYAFESGVSLELTKQLFFGVGLRVITVSQYSSFEVKALELLELEETSAQDLFFDSLQNAQAITGVGFDIGTIYQYNSKFRLGASVQNLGLKLDGKIVVPKLTTGLSYILLNTISTNPLGTNVNLAFDIEDILVKESIFLDKFNFGVEWYQGILLAELRLALGVSRFNQYSAGFGIEAFFFEINIGTWVEKDYISLQEDRLYNLNSSINF